MRLLRHLLSAFAVVAAMLPAAPVHANVVTDFLALSYPAVGINLPVFEGSVDSTGTVPVPYQPVAAWHYPSTGWPGQPAPAIWQHQGNRTVLFAHDQPSYFSNLAYSRPGDRVYVHRSDGRTIGYTVSTNQLISSTDYSWLQPNPGGI